MLAHIDLNFFLKDYLEGIATKLLKIKTILVREEITSLHTWTKLSTKDKLWKLSDESHCCDWKLVNEIYH